MKTLSIIFCILISINIFSQSSQNLLLDKLVNKGLISDNEAKEIENFQENNPLSENGLFQRLLTLSQNNYIKVSGYSQMVYNYNSANIIKSDLGIRSAYFTLSGKPHSRLDYVFSYDFSRNIISDINLTWGLLENLGVKVGLQKIPIGIEYNISSSKIELIRNVYMDNYLFLGSEDVFTTKANGISTGRDMGINLFGEIKSTADKRILSYALAAFQGGGVSNSNLTNKKNFASALYLYPTNGLQIGGGVYAGSAFYSEGYNVEGEINKSESHVRNRWVVSSEFKNERYTFRSEYAEGNDAGNKIQSGYILNAYLLLPKLQIVAQYDWIKTNSNSSAHKNGYTAGGTYFVNKWSKLMLNYVLTQYSKEWKQKNNSTIEAQVVIFY